MLRHGSDGSGDRVLARVRSLHHGLYPGGDSRGGVNRATGGTGERPLRSGVLRVGGHDGGSRDDCGKLIILQGISGTGKTSLAYAWGKFMGMDACVSSVEPSWRDKSDFLGYFNEFTKKFNETKALGEIYAASFDDDVHTIILDEMNLARVEYYFLQIRSLPLLYIGYHQVQYFYCL